jgi:hypothetical protein
MNKIKKALFAPIGAILSFAVMFVVAVPVFAQDVAQQQINAGLCTGSNLEFTEDTSAKNTILYAIIGLIIVALAQVLVRFTLNKVTNT